MSAASRSRLASASATAASGASRAMAATTLTGRRLLEGLRDDEAVIETRLALGDDVRTALRPTIRTAMVTGLVPAIDQTRSVGLVTLPGTFVGLVNQARDLRHFDDGFELVARGFTFAGNAVRLVDRV